MLVPELRVRASRIFAPRERYTPGVDGMEKENNTAAGDVKGYWDTEMGRRFTNCICQFVPLSVARHSSSTTLPPFTRALGVDTPAVYSVGKASSAGRFTRLERVAAASPRTRLTSTLVSPFGTDSSDNREAG